MFSPHLSILTHFFPFVSVAKFPFDTQSCQIILESWDSTALVRLSLDGPGIFISNESDFISKSSIWTLVGFNATMAMKVYPDTPTEYDQAVFTFTLERKYQIHLLNIFMPCLALQVLISLSVFMPPQLPDRSQFCVTVVLAYTVLQGVVSSQIPNSSETVFVVIFLAFQLLASLLITCFTLLTSELGRRLSFKKFYFYKFSQNGKWRKITIIRIIDLSFYSVAIVTIVCFDLFVFIHISTPGEKN